MNKNVLKQLMEKGWMPSTDPNILVHKNGQIMEAEDAKEILKDEQVEGWIN